MTYLLDTQVLVWAAADPDRLGESARACLEELTNELLVSAASAWELSTKVRLGKFPEAEPLVMQFDEIVSTLGARHLGVDHRHALRAGSLVWSHRDPFDRMLAAQALLENHVLLSRDRAFSDLGGLTVVW